MELKTFINILHTYRKRFWLTTATIFMVGMIITLSQPLKYGTESRIFISQVVGPGVDMYTMSKSNEYLSNTLAEVARSTAFFHDVINTNPNIDQAYFTSKPSEQLKIWRKTVDANVLSDSGVVVISVYHTDQAQAVALANGINNTLRFKGGQYYNSSSQLFIKVLDEPVVSNWPIKPNVLINAFSSLLLGFALSLFYIYILATNKTEAEGERSNPTLGQSLSVPKFEVYQPEPVIKPVPPVVPPVAVPSAPVAAPVVNDVPTPVVAKPVAVEPVAPTIAPVVPEEKAVDDFLAKSDIRNVFN